MSTPTGDPRVVAELNELLGRELGRNEYGKPYFTWRWSEDLIWPAFATGKTNIRETRVLTPIIGAPADQHDFVNPFVAHPGYVMGTCEVCDKLEADPVHNVYSIMQVPEHEYKADRQTRKRDTWFICKWLTPWELILGPREGSIKHGDQQGTDKAPSHEALVGAWNRQFPGAQFPSKGWRIPTDAYLPNGPRDENWSRSPFGHTSPHRQDTEHFIAQVKFQTSRPFTEVEKDMLAREDAAGALVEKWIGEECREAFPAYLNPKPGTRGRASGGGFISMPWTKFDRSR